MQLPSSVVNALMLPFNAANVGTMAYPFLTIAAGNMLYAAGNADQHSRYLIPMLAGRYFGTMNLSEPQAGSSLGDICTTATRRSDGRFSIKGTKMWISGGEHSLSENIIHMVLAKIRDPITLQTSPGVRGISLFIVPKYRLNPDNSRGVPNDISIGGLNHKVHIIFSAGFCYSASC